MAALSHPNVLTVHDVGHENGHPYVVIELLEGETLRDRLERGPLPMRRSIEVAVDVCRGLEAAHGRELVHRDLKPENVFLTTDGRVKILDFGLAKLRKGEGIGELAGGERLEPGGALAAPPDDTRTADGVILGTLGYLSPSRPGGSSTTRAPTCSRWGRFCTRCSRAAARSRGRPPRTPSRRSCRRTRRRWAAALGRSRPPRSRSSGVAWRRSRTSASTRPTTWAWPWRPCWSARDLDAPPRAGHHPLEVFISTETLEAGVHLQLCVLVKADGRVLVVPLDGGEVRELEGPRSPRAFEALE